MLSSDSSLGNFNGIVGSGGSEGQTICGSGSIDKCVLDNKDMLEKEIYQRFGK